MLVIILCKQHKINRHNVTILKPVSRLAYKERRILAATRSTLLHTLNPDCDRHIVFVRVEASVVVKFKLIGTEYKGE